MRQILVDTRHRAARSVNAEMVRAYWLIGQVIANQEQQGQERAGHGERLIESLSQRLTEEFGRGFSKNNLWYMRQFHIDYSEKLHALRGELSWTHYCLLLKVDNLDARAFYEREASEQGWSTRTLERQITTLFYERLALSSGQKAMLEQARSGSERHSPQEIVKDPFILEFLGLRETPALTENQLESAILSYLQDLLKGVEGPQVVLTDR
ncbi:MAG: hypothetical protein IT210_22055 [Armatimonadetes bacterium]|nr:hypothetical protein [Armatimonadota bacterium]